jgi:hypothetical protein
MKTFLTIFLAVLLAVLASAGVLYFIATRRLHTRPAAISPHDAFSPEEAYARRLMKGLSADDVISVCGKPTSDYVGEYGDFKWRILAYRDFEVNLILKEGHWQYDFMSDGHGRILPDASMVTRPVAIKLPCQR